MDPLESPRRVAALVLKEILALLKDPKSRIVVIVPPILQTIIFGYTATFDLTQVPYAYDDRSHSVESRALLAGLEGSTRFRLVKAIEREEEIKELINAGTVRLVLRIGQEFARDLQAGREARVQAILDGRNSNTAGIVGNYLTEVVRAFNLARTQAAGQKPASVLVARAWFNENLLSRWFFIPGLVGLIAMVVTLLVTALSVAREREHGTFDQLLVTPMPPLEILIGKALPGLLIGVAEATLIIVLAVFWFDVPLRGNTGLLYLGLAFFIFATVGIGLMISSFSVTMQQALLGSFLFLMPAVLLSGFATPIANMTPAVRLVTYVNPLRYVITLLRGVFIENAPSSVLLMQVWPLAVIGVVSMALAGWLFRNRIY